MRKIFLTIILVALAGAVGIMGYRYYRGVRQEQWLSQARVFLAKADFTNAVLRLQRAIRINPRDAEAYRLMAGLAEADRSASAVGWRARVVEINPHSLEDRLALAQTALVMNDVAMATNALGGVDETGQKTAMYHNLAGAASAAGKRFEEAEAHFAEAARIEPGNASWQLNLAALQMRRTDTNLVAQARARLKQLRANPEVRCEVLRELIRDALRFQETNAALGLSKELLQQTNAVFRDQLLRLDVLRQTENGELKAAVAGCQREATPEPAKIHDLARWQMASGSAREALAWLRTLPSAIETSQPVALLEAECRATLRDWAGLDSSLERQTWGEMDFTRRAFRSLALRELRLSEAAKTEWASAVKAGEGRQERLVMLLRLAAQWNWPAETEEILWAIFNGYPGEKWAGSALSTALHAQGRTQSLMTLFSKQLAANPADLDAKNNLATVALLRNAPEHRPHELAREVYEKDPKNASYAATYAYSLHVLGKNAEALQVMEQLNPDELEMPMVSGYYGLLLKASGDTAKAKKYLEISSKAVLLPEEKEIFDKAKAGA
jgi:Flp pilus assembly protein TadD